MSCAISAWSERRTVEGPVPTARAAFIDCKLTPCSSMTATSVFCWIAVIEDDSNGKSVNCSHHTSLYALFWLKKKNGPKGIQTKTVVQGNHVIQNSTNVTSTP